jgi:hypothetical protein
MLPVVRSLAGAADRDILDFDLVPGRKRLRRVHHRRQQLQPELHSQVLTEEHHKEIDRVAEAERSR